MIRFSRLTAILATAVSAALAQAHFTFVVPGNANDARIFLSETLEPEEGIPVEIIANAKLLTRDADGKDTPLAISKAADGKAYEAALPANTRIIHGYHDLGVNNRGGSKMHWLQYYPKTILGDVFASPVITGDSVPVELIPHGKPGETKLLYLVDGKPKTEVDVMVVLPDGTSKEVKTDSEGFTPAFDQAGRYAIWARDWQDTPGEQAGKQYEQVRRYAMLVFDVQGTPPVAKAAPTTSPVVADTSTTSNANPHSNSARPGRNAGAFAARPPVQASPFGIALPEATSSFGAVALDGWLYVYGGHISPTHEYHTQAVSGQFHRLDLAEGKEWKALPSGPGLQGMNITAHAGKIYRVGGMQPVNAPGTPADLRSIDEASVFDPSVNAWQALPKLPQSRSSHDIVALSDRLYVLGGWNLNGPFNDATETWPDAMYTLDLRSPDAGWQALPQPFQRRALIAAVYDGKVFAIGGFDSTDRPSRRVDIYDPQTNTWSRGPGLPGAVLNGFSPAACVQNNQLFVSVGDGSLYRLNSEENLWEPVGTGTPRIVHRLVPSGSKILIIGGAAKGDNLDLIESISIAPSSATPIAGRSSRQSITTGSAPAAAPVAPTAAPASPAAATKLTPEILAAVAKQTHCPVMTDDEVDEESVTVMYQGVPIKLCCSTCIRRWNANPEKYTNRDILPQLSLTTKSVAATSDANGSN